MFACHTIIGVVASLDMLAAPVSARTWAGGVNMNTACVSQWGVSFHAQNDKADNAANSAYDWNLDVGAFCAGRYGGNAYADPQGKKKYDWGCYYP
ncbi:hypothetical protein COL26b_013118 [Colletotrichum chrysophilum]|uniref:uncharacterized protein n=1 Tax=Colletotrichum chrysophilum TaxID=1836956 RepID=UPI0023015758|nr:uncharacterized protein COL26b_013118 [Colletotrichum chrysophilum]KAJ0363056.1 hypothetical protein COL26b_013118 [Colletotrichum chrysophilum]